MEYAEEYNQIKSTNQTISEWCDSMAESVLKTMKFNSQDIIMDYGCGPGDIAFKHLVKVEKYKKIYGVDISPTMVETARKINSHPNIEYIVGDIMSLDGKEFPFGKESLDKMISFFVVCYFENFGAFFRRVHSIMKPGGQVGFIIPWGLENCVVPKIVKKEKWAKYDQVEKVQIAKWCCSNEMPDFIASLKSSGFQILMEEKEEKCLEFEKLRNVCDFITNYDPLLSRIPENLKPQFLDDVEEVILKIVPNAGVRDDGSAFLVQKAVKIVAQKLL